MQCWIFTCNLTRTARVMEHFTVLDSIFLNIYILNPISAMSNPASPAEVSRTLFMLATAWLGPRPNGSAVGQVPHKFDWVSQSCSFLKCSRYGLLFLRHTAHQDEKVERSTTVQFCLGCSNVYGFTSSIHTIS